METEKNKRGISWYFTDIVNYLDRVEYYVRVLEALRRFLPDSFSLGMPELVEKREEGYMLLKLIRRIKRRLMKRRDVWDLTIKEFKGKTVCFNLEDRTDYERTAYEIVESADRLFSEIWRILGAIDSLTKGELVDYVKEILPEKTLIKK